MGGGHLFLALAMGHMPPDRGQHLVLAARFNEDTKDGQAAGADAMYFMIERRVNAGFSEFAFMPNLQ
jgi:hypothetical protein